MGFFFLLVIIVVLEVIMIELTIKTAVRVVYRLTGKYCVQNLSKPL